LTFCPKITVYEKNIVIETFEIYSCNHNTYKLKNKCSWCKLTHFSLSGHISMIGREKIHQSQTIGHCVKFFGYNFLPRCNKFGLRAFVFHMTLIYHLGVLFVYSFTHQISAVNNAHINCDLIIYIQKFIGNEEINIFWNKHRNYLLKNTRKCNLNWLLVYK